MRTKKKGLYKLEANIKTTVASNMPMHTDIINLKTMRTEEYCVICVEEGKYHWNGARRVTRKGARDAFRPMIITVSGKIA